jgi:hypothetical protein
MTGLNSEIQRYLNFYCVVFRRCAGWVLRHWLKSVFLPDQEYLDERV